MGNHSNVHLSVIIPAFNEQDRLPRTLEHVLGYVDRQPYEGEVLVVDDGSTDKTEYVVRQWPRGATALRLVRHPDGDNHGKGAAVRCGMAAASGRFRLFMDADNSTTIDQVENLWPFVDDEYDVVFGSRGIHGARIVVHQPWYKELGGRLGNLVIRALVMPGVADTQAGFKMLTQKSIEDLLPRLTVDRWGFDVELLVAARCRGYQIKEVPITWVDVADSKVSARAYAQVLADVWRIRRQRRAGQYG